MFELFVCDDPFSLDDLARRIRASSNFRFAWQFFRCRGRELCKASDFRFALEIVIANPQLHNFLLREYESLSPFERAEPFSVKPLHEHSLVVSNCGELEFLLAAAANNQIGAFSKEKALPMPEFREVRDLFSGIGKYFTYDLIPGRDPTCPECRNHNNHLFSNWFYDVAWDWCLFAYWPKLNVLWMGCLTDTD